MARYYQILLSISILMSLKIGNALIFSLSTDSKTMFQVPTSSVRTSRAFFGYQLTNSRQPRLSLYLSDKQSDLFSGLSSLKRAHLQTLAKQNGIKANLKSNSIIDQLIPLLGGQHAVDGIDENMDPKTSDVSDDHRSDYLTNILREQGLQDMEELLNLQKDFMTGIISLENDDVDDTTTTTGDTIDDFIEELYHTDGIVEDLPTGTKFTEIDTADTSSDNPVKDNSGSSIRPYPDGNQVLTPTVEESHSGTLIACSGTDTSRRGVVVRTMKNRESSSPSSPSITTTTTTTTATTKRPASTQKKIRKKQISLDGITLEDMLTLLVDRIGFPQLYERTNIRCFDQKPSLTSSLKALRRPNMQWARHKIEYLYVECRRREENYP